MEYGSIDGDTISYLTLCHQVIHNLVLHFGIVLHVYILYYYILEKWLSCLAQQLLANFGISPSLPYLFGDNTSVNCKQFSLS